MKDGLDPPADSGRETGTGRHVAVIGGGASGVLMGLHLLRQPGDLRVTLIEGQGPMGLGIAYATTDPEHLLNTRVHNMSAFHDDPHHFHRWLEQRADGAKVSDQGFVSRATYGAYLGALLAENDDNPRLHRLFQAVVGLQETDTGVNVQLADGQSLDVDRAVLATGHATPDKARQWPIVGAWQPHVASDPQGLIILIGSGLSMVDQVLSILKSGHEGPILSFSRRGLLPRNHTNTAPLKVQAAELPLGASVASLLRWARSLARLAEASGGTWRDAVDGIRPHVRTIWRALPQVERARFLRHAATWWDVHRHRIPPQSQIVLDQAVLDGQLTIRKATFQEARTRPDGLVDAVIRPFRRSQTEVLTALRIVDCRGIRRDPETHASPLVAGLLSAGTARIDPLRIGLEVDDHGRLIRADSTITPAIYAIGPASRAAFWEITAIPDIREQVARLAATLATQPAFHRATTLK